MLRTLISLKRVRPLHLTIINQQKKQSNTKKKKRKSTDKKNPSSEPNNECEKITQMQKTPREGEKKDERVGKLTQGLKEQCSKNRTPNFFTTAFFFTFTCTLAHIYPTGLVPASTACAVAKHVVSCRTS
jgi:hypothetical protein